MVTSTDRHAGRNYSLLEIGSWMRTVSHGDGVYQGHAHVGVVTSATRSPLTGQNIALCRISVHSAAVGTRVEVGQLDGHQKRLSAIVSAPIFYDPDKSRVRA